MSKLENLDKEQVAAAKSRGFLRNRGTECFSGRVVSAGGVYTAEQLERIAGCAREFGSGSVAFTARLSAEIVGIPFELLEAAEAYLGAEDSGLTFGGTGPKIRPVVACKGTTCIFGMGDTQELARRLHERYYLDRGGERLPHKFKIAVGGCPNSCMKPSLNDFGLEARKRGGETLFRVFVGGTWGKKTRVGTELSRPVRPEEVFPVLDGVIRWYREHAPAGERLGATLDRVGVDSLEREAFSGLPERE